MLDLVKRLRDLKDLISPAYYADLLALVRNAIGGDWRTVHTRLFILLGQVTEDLLFGPTLTRKVEAAAAPDSTAELDAAFDDLAKQTVTTTADAKVDPGTWLAIVGAVVELIKLIRDRKK